MGLSWQVYRSGLPFPPPRDLPDPGIEPTSLTSPALVTEIFMSFSFKPPLLGGISGYIQPHVILSNTGLTLKYYEKHLVHIEKSLSKTSCQ